MLTFLPYLPPAPPPPVPPPLAENPAAPPEPPPISSMVLLAEFQSLGTVHEVPEVSVMVTGLGVAVVNVWSLDVAVLPTRFFEMIW